MKLKSFGHIFGRTLDYLSRRHPWFDAIMRRRIIAVFLLLGYGAFVFLLVWQVHGGDNDGWREIIKTYSALFFDLLVLFLLSIIFLFIRGYYSEEASRIDSDLQPERSLFLPLQTNSVTITIDDSHFFQRHGAIASILDALPIDQSDFFLAHAGSLDIPKLTLLRIEKTRNNGIHLRLGMGAFREFFFTHHFADYILSRSSSKDSGRKDTLRTLLSEPYLRKYTSFFNGTETNLDLLNYTPNTLGITGCVRVLSGEESIIFFQRRGLHESAARGVLHLSYAGTINALPNYAAHSGEISLNSLADDEFYDEFMSSAPGTLLKERSKNLKISHELVGICANSQYLFQPEIFILTTINVNSTNLTNELLEKFSREKSGQFLALQSLDELMPLLEKNALKLRPLCMTAINEIYRPRLSTKKKKTCVSEHTHELE